jgi:hypothetical protein
MTGKRRKGDLERRPPFFLGQPPTTAASAIPGQWALFPIFFGTLFLGTINIGTYLSGTIIYGTIVYGIVKMEKR